MKVNWTGLYCAGCGTLQRDDHAGKPCQKCSGIVFAAVQPNWDWILTPADRDFLKSVRIQP